MTDSQPTVTYLGRVDEAKSAAVTVAAHGTSRRLPVGEAVAVPRSIAERCDALRDTFRFEIHGLQAAGAGGQGDDDDTPTTTSGANGSPR